MVDDHVHVNSACLIAGIFGTVSMLFLSAENALLVGFGASFCTALPANRASGLTRALAVLALIGVIVLAGFSCIALMNHQMQIEKIAATR